MLVGKRDREGERERGRERAARENGAPDRQPDRLRQPSSPQSPLIS